MLSLLGLDPARVDPAIYRQLASILRIVVQGMIEVLHSRAEVKNNFRMSLTSIRPVENNPLKFSFNAEDALHNLFVKRNPGYLGPTESFQEGFLFFLDAYLSSVCWSKKKVLTEQLP